VPLLWKLIRLVIKKRKKGRHHSKKLSYRDIVGVGALENPKHQHPKALNTAGKIERVHMKRRLTSVMLLTISPNVFAMDNTEEKTRETDTTITKFYCCRNGEGKKTEFSVLCYEENDTEYGEIHRINYDTTYENSINTDKSDNKGKFTYERRRLKEALEKFKKSIFKKAILTNEDGLKYWEEKSLEGL